MGPIRTLLRAALALSLAVAVGLLPGSRARAFCGFYVGGAGTSLYANATMVVLMREGTRTVLSMQNNYQGPPEDFAMVVPVPVVLQREDVKTLPREVFERVDRLAAPRLVEYWETDPCYVEPPEEEWEAMAEGVPMPSPTSHGVTVEASFAVGEYDIVILGAEEATGLETWLHENGYQIPEGAADVLRPYVEAGTKFFVARVDVERVTFVEGRAVLSPLRMHYDSETFSLPVRLGLLSSAGQQDLIVHILAPDQRYEVANYGNAFIPTNLRVLDAVRQDFGAFYEHVFSQTIERSPRTVVTEYSWSATSCDPCPDEPLTLSELATLGADLGTGPRDFTLTRLHYRYGREDLGEDLVFRAAPAVWGGRGIPDQEGQLQTAVEPSSWGGSQFQGRYVILHPWEQPVTCDSPFRGRWGGPPDDRSAVSFAPNTAMTQGIPSASPADRVSAWFAESVPSLGVTAESPAPIRPLPVAPSASSGLFGCLPSCGVADARSSGAWLGLLGLVAILARRRRATSGRAPR